MQWSTVVLYAQNSNGIYQNKWPPWNFDFQDFYLCQKWVCSQARVKDSLCIGVYIQSGLLSGQTATVGLPGWAKKKDVLRLWQVNHLSFQSQTADLHPRELVLVLYSLHIQQALLSGLHHTYEYFIICSSLNLLQNWHQFSSFFFFSLTCFMHHPPLERVCKEKWSTFFFLYHYLSSTPEVAVLWDQSLLHLSIYCLMSTHKDANSTVSHSYCTFLSWVSIWYLTEISTSPSFSVSQISQNYLYCI